MTTTTMSPSPTQGNGYETFKNQDYATVLDRCSQSIGMVARDVTTVASLGTSQRTVCRREVTERAKGSQKVETFDN